jgi:hypothetical protein
MIDDRDDIDDGDEDDDAPPEFEDIHFEMEVENSSRMLEASRRERCAKEASFRREFADRWAAVAAIDDADLRAQAHEELERHMYVSVRFDQIQASFVHRDDEEFDRWMECLEAQPDMRSHLRYGRMEQGTFIPTSTPAGWTGFQYDEAAEQAYTVWLWRQGDLDIDEEHLLRLLAILGKPCG